MIRAAFALLCCMFWISADVASCAEAKNIRVIDGDTFECDLELEFRIGLRKVMVRVYDLDTWEATKARPGLNLTAAQWDQELLKGKVAKQSLETLLKLAKKVTVRETGGTTFGRFECEVYADEIYVADEMTRKGHSRK